MPNVQGGTFLVALEAIEYSFVCKHVGGPSILIYRAQMLHARFRRSTEEEGPHQARQRMPAEGYRDGSFPRLIRSSLELPFSAPSPHGSGSSLELTFWALSPHGGAPPIGQDVALHSPVLDQFVL